MENSRKKIFNIKQKGSTILTEIISGLVVFFAMSYILPVNSTILGGIENASYEAIFVATALCSGICCIFMGIFANYPVVLSAGMGMNAYLAYTVCGIMGYSFAEGLLLIFIAGILFFIFTLTPFREKIISAIPYSIKLAVSAGLGAFVCFVGLKNGGIIQASTGTFVTLGNLKSPTVLLALFGIILVLILMQVKGIIGKLAIVISMFVTALLGFILHCIGIEGMPHFTFSNVNDNLMIFKDNLFLCFKEKDVFKNVFSNPQSYIIIFSLILVHLFDTTATLIAVGKKVGIIGLDGKLIGGKKAMLADAVGAVICAPLGTSTVSSFAESSIGVENGARTGLSSCVTGILFLLSIFIYPIFSIFSGVQIGMQNFTPVTSLALVSVGCLMFSNLKDIDWEDKIIVITSFLIIIFMLLTYSLSDGIGLGLIIYCLMMLSSKRYKEVPCSVYAISLIFVIYYVLKIFI